MNRNLVIDAMIGCGCLIAGILAAAWVFSSRASEPNTEPAISSYSGAATSKSDLESVEPIKPKSAVTMEAIVAFAERWEKIETTPAQVEAFSRWVNSFQADDFETFFTSLVSLDTAPNPTEAMQTLFARVFDSSFVAGDLLFERWAKVSPDSLVRMVGTAEQMVALHLAATGLPYLWALDPQSAAALLADIKAKFGQDFERDFESRSFLIRLHSVSELAAISWAIENPKGIKINDLFLNRIQDGDAVLKLLHSMQGEARDSAISEFFTAFAQQNPASAKALLSSLGSDLDPDKLYAIEQTVTFHWILEDPENRIDLSHRDVEMLLVDWMVQDPAGIAAWLNGAGASKVPKDLFGNLVTLSADDLEFDFVLEHSNLAELELRISPWTETSVGSWIGILSDEQLDRVIAKAPEAGIAELYNRDPDRAIELAASIDDGWSHIAAKLGADPQRRADWLANNQLVDSDSFSFFAAWAAQNPAEAFAASQDYPTATETVVDEWLNYEDADVVYAAVGERLHEMNYYQRIQLLAALGERDPQSAGEAMLENNLESGVPDLIFHWVVRDPVEASRFIRDHLEPGTVRDQAVRNLATTIVRQDEASAREWVATIDNPDFQQAATSELNTLLTPPSDED